MQAESGPCVWPFVSTLDPTEPQAAGGPPVVHSASSRSAYSLGSDFLLLGTLGEQVPGLAAALSKRVLGPAAASQAWCQVWPQCHMTTLGWEGIFTPFLLGFCVLGHFIISDGLHLAGDF